MTSTTLNPNLDDDKALVEPDDPCHSYTWSIFFLLALVIAILLIIVECHALFKRRQELFSGFDIGLLFLFACTIIQFGPKMSNVIHEGHGYKSYTQSGCKLLHYTDYGIRMVIVAIILALVLYAWLITKHNFNQEQVDKRIRNNLAWLILLSFAIEAVFGMPIAIYVDVYPNFPDHCVWTPTIHLTQAQIAALEVGVRSVLPYVLPSLILPFPLLELRRTLISVEGAKLKSQIHSIVVIGWAYIILNIPYTITFLIHFAKVMSGDFNTLVCNFQWFFFLVHQCFFILVPCLMLKHESVIGNVPWVSVHLELLWIKIMTLWSSARDDRTELM